MASQQAQYNRKSSSDKKVRAKIDRTKKESNKRYLQIADQLTSQIQAGDYPVDALLPTEKELCEQHEASRHTIREALRQLSNAGLIERRQGAGSIVKTTQPPAQYNQFVQTIDDLLQYGEATRFDIKRSQLVSANKKLANLIGCQAEQPLIHLHGVRYLRHSKEPFCVSDIYRLSCTKAMQTRYLDKEKAIFAILDELDLPNLSKVEQYISAVALNTTQAKILKREPHSPALQTIRHYFDNQEQKIVVAVSYHPNDRYTFSTVLKRL